MWRDWAGFFAVSSYEVSHEREYNAIRNAAALIDISPLFKYRLTGKDAGRLVDRVITRDASKIAVGQVVYTSWCDGDGKVIDDGTVSRLEESVYRWTAAEPNLRWFREASLGLDVRVEDISETTASLALQGPTSREILKAVTDGDVASLKYFRVRPFKLRGIPVEISRTGYTGDLGYEIWLDASRALEVWDALMEAGRPFDITPSGIYALDVARIEAGLLLIEVDYFSSKHALIEAQKSSPLELGLGWTVATDKQHFNGSEALARERERGPSWQFSGLTVDWDSLEQLYADVGLPPRLPSQAWRTSVPIYDQGGHKQVGYATSGGWSPLLKQYLALAHLEAGSAKPGTSVRMEITVEHRRKQAIARVTPLPFFNPDRKRA